MASTKLAFLAVAILLLQASWCALSQQGGTSARMEITSFEQGGDGGDPAACDGQYHSDGDMLAALPTQWYAGGSRCQKQIRITWGLSPDPVVATVVDECDSQSGCGDNIIATSPAVWQALHIDPADAGDIGITWVDA